MKGIESVRQSVADATSTAVFWAGFGGTLVRYDLMGRLAARRSMVDFEWCMARLQASLLTSFRAAGLQVVVDKHPDVQDHQPYVIISNHQSLLDIPLIGGTMVTNLPKYVAKQELASGIPAISLNLSRGDHALIDRDNPGQAVDEIIGLGQRSQARGTSVVIFPEGTRSRDGSLRRFKRAGTMKLLDAAPNLQVVPVALSGSWRLNSLAPYPRGHTVTIRIGAPIERDASSKSVFEQARNWITQHVDPDA